MEALADNFPEIPESILARVLLLCGNCPDTAYAWLEEYTQEDEVEAVDESENERDEYSSVVVIENDDDNMSDNISVNDDIYELEDSNNRETETASIAEEESLRRAAARAMSIQQIYERGLFVDMSNNDMKKRKYVTPSTSSPKNGEKRYWVRFDDQIMAKSHLELLNIGLEKTAHTSVSLLSSDARFVCENEAMRKLSEYTKNAKTVNSSLHDNNKTENGNIKNKRTSIMRDAMEKITNEKQNIEQIGYWAHFFDIQDVDEVWRGMLSAFAVEKKFGEATTFEIRSCSGGASNNRAFDIQSETQRGRGLPSICVIVPCKGTEDEIFAVGSNLMSTLLLTNPIYYRRHDLNDSEEKTDPNQAMFDIVSKDEHILASVFKILHTKEETTEDELARKKSQHLQNLGFFPTDPRRLHTMYSLDSVCWRPVRTSF
mmetsp:Transcript_107/g.165  ORF Transcript_107/g.165 Transcript_107/m.165 type:complete len:430 (-) Transcript_107:225-1514(-)